MDTAIDNHNKAVRINPVAVYGDITRTAIVISANKLLANYGLKLGRFLKTYGERYALIKA